MSKEIKFIEAPYISTYKDYRSANAGMEYSCVSISDHTSFYYCKGTFTGMQHKNMMVTSHSGYNGWSVEQKAHHHMEQRAKNWCIDNSEDGTIISVAKFDRPIYSEVVLRSICYDVLTNGKLPKYERHEWNTHTKIIETQARGGMAK